MVELFATVVALHTFRERLVGSWSLLLVDSEAERILSSRRFVRAGRRIVEHSFGAQGSADCISTEFRHMPTQPITRPEIGCRSVLD